MGNDIEVINKRYPTIKEFFDKNSGVLAEALPRIGLNPERFAITALTAIRGNINLLSCSESSLFGACFKAAQLGLMPGLLGESYIIPYGNEAAFQIGYKGLIKLAYRAKEVKVIDAHEVYEKDKFSYSFGLNPTLTHVPFTEKERGKIQYVYAVVKLDNGESIFNVMSVAEIEVHRDRFSKAWKSGKSMAQAFWKDNFPEMAKKTVIIKTLKLVPLSSEMQDAVFSDQTIQNYGNEGLVRTDMKFSDTKPDKEETVDVEAVLKDSSVAPDTTGMTDKEKETAAKKEEKECKQPEEQKLT